MDEAIKAKANVILKAKDEALTITTWYKSILIDDIECLSTLEMREMIEKLWLEGCSAVSEDEAWERLDEELVFQSLEEVLQ